MSFLFSSYTPSIVLLADFCMPVADGGGVFILQRSFGNRSLAKAYMKGLFDGCRTAAWGIPIFFLENIEHFRCE